MTGTVERGREMEEQVAAYFAAHGYGSRLNVTLEGRSGARHEVDVLAEKVDSLTTYRVAVECKAWRVPIDQDVVSKLAWVMSDLGLHKGIVVALAGARSGAERAAADLGIELWGGDEVARRLHHRPPAHLVLGLPVVVGPDRAGRVAKRARSGRIGPSREVMVASSLVWVPAYELSLALTRRHGPARRTQRHAAVTRSWHLYEALTGSLVEPGASPLPFAELDVGERALAPLVRESRLAGDLRRATARLAEVATDVAVGRHRAILGSLGVDATVEHLDVEASRLVHLPYHLSLLRRGDAERVVAVDGRSGLLSPVVSAAATATLRHVAEGLGWRR